MILIVSFFVIQLVCVVANVDTVCQQNDIRALLVHLAETEARAEVINASTTEYRTHFLTEIQNIQEKVSIARNQVQEIDTKKAKTSQAVEDIRKAISNITLTLTHLLNNVTGIDAEMTDLFNNSDGGWSLWSAWTECPVSCQGGLITRNRTCNNPTQSQFGRGCIGNDVDVSLCSSFLCPSIHHTDCKDLSSAGFDKSGVYTIETWKSKHVMEVYCDMNTDGGGWTVFQKRFNGSVDFYKSLFEYEKGFGNLAGEFWLGLLYTQEMTDPSIRPSELRVDLTAADDSTAYEVFDNFYLSDSNTYTLHIDRGRGTAGDNAGLTYNNGRGFTTYDRVIDQRSNNCAEIDRGGWWFNNCAYANLNGEYITPGTVSTYNDGEGGMTYRDFQGFKSLKGSRMMFRRYA